MNTNEYKEMFELPDGLLTADAGMAAEEWAGRYFEARDMLREYQKETDACFELAQALAEKHPEFVEGFRGNPSERLTAILKHLEVM